MENPGDEQCPTRRLPVWSAALPVSRALARHCSLSLLDLSAHQRRYRYDVDHGAARQLSMVMRDAGHIRLIAHLHTLFLPRLRRAVGVANSAQPRDSGCHRGDPRSPATGTCRPAYLGQQPVALVAAGSALAAGRRRVHSLMIRAAPGRRWRRYRHICGERFSCNV